MNNGRNDKFAKVVFNIAVDKEFDYFIPGDLSVAAGCRVWVKFGRASRVGLVTRTVDRSAFSKTNPVLEVLDRIPVLSREQIEFAGILKKEYPYSLGEFIFMMIPDVLRRNKTRTSMESCPVLKREKGFSCCFYSGPDILSRITSYLPEIKESLSEGTVFFCLPSVDYLNLVKPLLNARFPGRVLELTGYQKRPDFLRNWELTRRENSIVLGLRRFLFYFPRNLSMIVVEEENSPYYFHQEKPYCNLRDIAWDLSGFRKIPLILAGDYPGLKVFRRITEKKAGYSGSPGRQAPVEVLIARSIIYKKTATIINPLIEELIRKGLEEKKKIAVFYNKARFSYFIRCTHCGYIYTCPNCSGFLSISLKEDKAVCSWCHHKQDIPAVCRKCSSTGIVSSGIGIERLERILKRHFPYCVTEDISSSSAGDIMLSTYPAFDSPALLNKNIDLGFVLDCDSFLSRVDFKATARLYGYLKRLASTVKDRVYAFTHNPGHYLWEELNRPWESFYKKEMELREEAGLPPYKNIAKITFRGRDDKGVCKKITGLYNNFCGDGRFQVFGPVKDSPFFLRGNYYYSVIIKSDHGRVLREKIKETMDIFRKGTVKIAVVLE